MCNRYSTDVEYGNGHYVKNEGRKWYNKRMWTFKEHTSFLTKVMKLMRICHLQRVMDESPKSSNNPPFQPCSS